MKKLFLKAKPSAVLLLLKDAQQAWYPSKLARESSSSYVHTVNLLSQLRKLGVVSVEKKGRQNIYKLAERGAQLASLLDDFSKKCEAVEAEAKSAQARQDAAQPAAQEDKKEEKKPEAEKK